MFIPLDLMLETLPGYAPVRKGRANVGGGLARLEGVEPPARGFEGRCSIQLSYRRVRGIVPCAKAPVGGREAGWFALTDPVP